MGIWNLKRGDTGITFRTVLKDPDLTVHDLSVGNPSAVNLHIWLSDGTILAARTMTIEGDGTAGAVTYVWVDADWNAGALVVSPTYPLAPSVRDHRMEYEVIRPAAPKRLTFPNDSYDTLRVLQDIGD